MTHVYFYALHLRRQVLCHHKAAHHVTSHLFSHTLRCGYCKMADSRFEKSLDVSESSEENEAAKALNGETLAEYPQEVTSFAFVNQSKSNEARNFSLLSFLRHLGFFWFSQWIFSKPCYFAHALFLCRESDPDPLGHVRRMYDVRMTSPQAAGYSLIHPNDVSRSWVQFDTSEWRQQTFPYRKWFV